MKIKDMALISLFSALIAVCSWITIPAAVPFTMQTFGVFLALGVLGGKRGTIAVLVYILLGAVGLPVFSGFKGGVSALLGNTGGYIAGFIISALVMWLFEHLFGQRPVFQIAGMALGLFLLYAFGTAWFMLVYIRENGAVTLTYVLSLCVIPFVIPDALKLSLSYLISRRLKRFLPKSKEVHQP